MMTAVSNCDSPAVHRDFAWIAQLAFGYSRPVRGKVQWLGIERAPGRGARDQPVEKRKQRLCRELAGMRAYDISGRVDRNDGRPCGHCI